MDRPGRQGESYIDEELTKAGLPLSAPKTDPGKPQQGFEQEPLNAQN